MTGARKHSRGKGGTTTAQTSTLKKSASPSTLTPKKKGTATPAAVTGSGTAVSPRGGSGVPTTPRRGGTSTPGSTGTLSPTLSGRPLVGGVPKAAPSKPPADAERRKAVTAAAADLTALADHRADSTYLSTDDDAQYRDLHDAAVLTLEEIAGHPEITAADRTAAERTVTALADAATALRQRAAATRIESDGFKKEITEAVTDLSARLKALQDREAYLDAQDRPSSNTTHSTTADEAAKVAKQARVTDGDRAAALKKIAAAKLAVTDLQAEADAAKTESDGYRAKLTERIAQLPNLLGDDRLAFLAGDRAAEFRTAREECETALRDAVTPQRVLTMPYDAAVQSYDDLTESADELEKQAAAVEKALTTRRATQAAALQAITKANKHHNIDVTDLNDMRKKLASAVADKRWADVDAELDTVRDEAAKVSSYIEGLDTAQERITKLPGTSDKFALRQDRYAPFQRAVTARPRDDTTASRLLNELNDALQKEEDKLEQNAAARIVRDQQRAAGLLPGRGGPAIPTASRGTVGVTPEERAAVVEALDALRDPSRDRSWAAKWGEYHGNGEGNLPGARGTGGYTEYYVRRAPGQQNVRRLVRHTATGRVYYSPNHYGSVDDGARPFVKVTDP